MMFTTKIAVGVVALPAALLLPGCSNDDSNDDPCDEETTKTDCEESDNNCEWIDLSPGCYANDSAVQDLTQTECQDINGSTWTSDCLSICERPGRESIDILDYADAIALSKEAVAFEAAALRSGPASSDDPDSWPFSKKLKVTYLQLQQSPTKSNGDPSAAVSWVPVSDFAGNRCEATLTHTPSSGSTAEQIIFNWSTDAQKTCVDSGELPPSQAISRDAFQKMKVALVNNATVDGTTINGVHDCTKDGCAVSSENAGFLVCEEPPRVCADITAQYTAKKFTQDQFEEVCNVSSNFCDFTIIVDGATEIPQCNEKTKTCAESHQDDGNQGDKCPSFCNVSMDIGLCVLGQDFDCRDLPNQLNNQCGYTYQGNLGEPVLPLPDGAEDICRYISEPFCQSKDL